MGLLVLILLILGAVCFGLAMVNVGARVNLVAAGLLCWIVTAIIDRAAGV
jgi:hypothetical protein